MTRSAIGFDGVMGYYHISSLMKYINETLGIEVMPINHPGGVHYDPHGFDGDDNSFFSPSTEALSFARMKSPAGWLEPGQTPEFDEFTLVLAGTLRVDSRDGAIEVGAGQAVITRAGEWVRYSSPHDGGAEYVAVCLPAFSPATVHRDEP